MAFTINRRNWLKFGAAFTTALSLPKPALSVTGNGKKPSGMVRIWGNENPYGPPESAVRAMTEELARGNRYVSPGLDFAQLENLIAEREGLAPENVVLGSGSGEVLTMAGAAFGLGGGEILAPTPTFEWLMRYAETVGGKTVRLPVNARQEIDLEVMDARRTPSVKLVYLCNPNNPTSTAIPAERLRSFCESTANQAVVFVDEAYIEYADPKVTRSMVELVRQGKNVIISRTFSKMYGMAGMRIGYGLARADLAARLRKFRMSWLNRAGFYGAIAALRDTAFVERSFQLNTGIRETTRAELSGMGMESAASQGNFLWVNVGPDRRNLPAALAGHDIRITGGTEALREDWARITIGTREDMARFLSAMKIVVARR